MRVLHVIPSVSPARGGPSFAVTAMVKALRHQGIDAQIASTNDDGDNQLDVPLNVLTNWNGVPVRFFERWSPSFRALREFSLSRDFSQWLRSSVGQYDLLHIHAVFSYTSTSAMRLCRRSRTPYINRPLGQLCAWSLRRRALKKSLYLSLVERRNLAAAASLHFTTEQEKSEAAALRLSTPGFVLPHGVELPELIPNARAALRAELNLPHNEKIILFLSRVHPKKGLDLLIPALAQLARTEKFTFIIAGNSEPPEYEFEIDGLLSLHGIQANTRRLGFVQGKHKQLLLQSADIFALTSHSENFGLSVLEALAAGLPVLLTPGVALADWVSAQRLGEVVEMDVESVAAALRRRLKQGPSSSNGPARDVIESHFSWTAIARSLAEQYKRACAQSHAR